MRALLLNTDAYSMYRRGDESVLDYLARADRVYMSLFVMAELFYGFMGGDRETADFYARVKQELKLKGSPIPINDVWIAAHCMELGAELVTFDRHFLAVPGLRTWPRLST